MVLYSSRRKRSAKHRESTSVGRILGTLEESHFTTNSAATEEQLEILRIDFNRLDDDCSGTIRGSALAQLLETQLGRLPTDNETSDVLKSFDIDEKGRISFDDYTQWLYPGAWPSVIAKWEAKASSSLCRLILELLPSVGAGEMASVKSCEMKSALTGDFTLIGLVFGMSSLIGLVSKSMMSS